MKEPEFGHVAVGNTYIRRDGMKAFVYFRDRVSQQFQCVIVGTQQFYTVYEDGKYYQAQDSHNDLIKEC